MWVNVAGSGLFGSNWRRESIGLEDEHEQHQRKPRGEIQPPKGKASYTGLKYQLT